MFYRPHPKTAISDSVAKYGNNYVLHGTGMHAVHAVYAVLDHLYPMRVMSKATKRKHVTREVLEGDVSLKEGQRIVKVE